MKLTKMIVATAMMVAGFGMTAHADNWASDPNMNHTVSPADCPLKKTNQNEDRTSIPTSVNNADSAHDFNVKTHQSHMSDRT